MEPAALSTPRAADRLRVALGLASVILKADGAMVVVPQGREAARLAAEILAGARCAWAPAGGGRRPQSPGRALVRTAGLADVLDLWRDDFVCRAGAGCTLAGLAAPLAGEGMRLAASAPLPQRATLGGAFAAGDRGLRGAPGGGLREAVIGLTAVDGAGTLVKAGTRVVKNVAGYDLMRLHHGARGAFGLILDFTLKLEPLPETERALLHVAALPQALEQLARLRRPATALDPVIQAWLSAGALRALGRDGPGGLLTMAQGWEATVRAWAVAAAGEPADGLAEQARDLGFAQPQRALWRWLATPSTALGAWRAAEAALERAGADPWLVLDLQNGHGMLALDATAPVDAVHRELADLAAASAPHGGVLVADRLPHALEAALDGAGALVPPSALERRLAEAFDPQDLLPSMPRRVAGRP
jgi:glycolate oxidase FAD binding subunit